ncbi:hypothetical protein IW140_003232 [Coemansia sp. RSA 1813]|nr:hypothetical protein LPJ74_002349 [Coemansia sp. RSA 1843]KAJ2089178.1 hypothetical protein IW138_003641 [Coemansia sp. RSA 986]KAJ2569257.1 hypothetical protein IW140_003232 [Coemansia sp. RSA 1813]
MATDMQLPVIKRDQDLPRAKTKRSQAWGAARLNWTHQEAAMRWNKWAGGEKHHPSIKLGKAYLKHYPVGGGPGTTEPRRLAQSKGPERGKTEDVDMPKPTEGRTVAGNKAPAGRGSTRTQPSLEKVNKHQRRS